jgi:hypothetical protein
MKYRKKPILLPPVSLLECLNINDGPQSGGLDFGVGRKTDEHLGASLVAPATACGARGLRQVILSGCKPHPQGGRIMMLMNASLPETYVKRIISFQKATFESSFNFMSMMQEQAERALQSAVGQVPWMPDEGKLMMEQWVGAMQEGRATFQKVVRDGFDQVAETLGRRMSESARWAMREPGGAGSAEPGKPEEEDGGQSRSRKTGSRK